MRMALRRYRTPETTNTASIPDRLIRTGAMNVEPIEEPIEPMILTSALVVASSTGVETIATIDLNPGLTTWLIALDTKIAKSRSPMLVPRRKGVMKQTTPSRAKPMSKICRFRRQEDHDPVGHDLSTHAREEPRCRQNANGRLVERRPIRRRLWRRRRRLVECGIGHVSGFRVKRQWLR